VFSSACSAGSLVGTNSADLNAIYKVTLAIFPSSCGKQSWVTLSRKGTFHRNLDAPNDK